MKFWERPFGKLLGVFLLLGLFAWWTFHLVSSSPSIRDLLDEDLAIASAANRDPANESVAEDLKGFPPPRQEHAPEVASLLRSLQELPPFPYALANALARDQATPGNQPSLPWTEEEKNALAETRAQFLLAWEGFFRGSTPAWQRYPDSVRLFRGSFFLSSRFQNHLALLGYEPGGKNTRTFLNEPTAFPEFYLPLLRQCRHLGVLRLGQPLWDSSETVRVADLTREIIVSLLLQPGYSPESLEALRTTVAPAPTLEDLRTALAVDRAVLSDSADNLDTLPPATPARSGLRWLFPEGLDASSLLQSYGQPDRAIELAGRLRNHAGQLETIRQKTFLSGPAWRQWLSHDPGRDLSPPLAGELAAFREFEDVRMGYLVGLAALEVRIFLGKGDSSAARRIPDPARPGSFLRVEDKPEGVQVASAFIPTGESAPVSFLLPPVGTETP